jgi:hypothetical protein
MGLLAPLVAARGVNGGAPTRALNGVARAAHTREMPEHAILGEPNGRRRTVYGNPAVFSLRLLRQHAGAANL